MKCTGFHPDSAPEATGRVRSVTVDGAVEVGPPLCDGCQASACVMLRGFLYISEASAVPLDYRERLEDAARSGAVRRIAGEIMAAPGSQDEIADMIVSALDALPRDGRHYSIKSVVLGKLERWAAEQDEGRATMLAEINPDEVF